ncbi:MAG: M42 family metallopeptidase [Clostridia bacterium]|nr:M42 family metallopeptidase [Clostridia bacterium]
MKFNVDRDYLIKAFKRIVSAPSPVGYSVKLNPVLKQMAAELGVAVTYDHKNTVYITLDGEDHSKTVLVGAHADTLGLMVRSINADGSLQIRKLGGGNMPSMEGETVVVHTRDGREYTGLLACRSHSVHVFSDAHTLERNEDTMMILLDEEVHSKEDVKALGIQNGDIVSIEPRCQYTENGYLKSRYIDDKGGIACCFAMLKYLVENDLKPKYRTILAFPYHEEIGIGGTYGPEGVTEYIAVDIGLIGPELDGRERAVSICAKDNTAPYDYELTNRLIDYAKKAECDYAVDVFFRYSTDANASLRAGNNLRNGAFGMAVYCSHGMERTHVTGLENTVNLLLAYVLDLK